MDQPAVACLSNPNQLDADGWMVRIQPWSERASTVKPSKNLELLIEYASSHYYTSSDGSPVVRRVMCVCDPPMRRCAPTQRRRACGCKLTLGLAVGCPVATCMLLLLMRLHLRACVHGCPDPSSPHHHHPSPCRCRPCPRSARAVAAATLIQHTATATARLIQRWRWHHLMCVLDRLYYYRTYSILLP